VEDRSPPAAGRAVVVGNGPSVDAMPPEFWRTCQGRADTVLVGTNRALCLKALRDVRLDVLVIRDNYRNLWHEPRWGALYHEQLWKPAGAWKVGSTCSRMTHCDEYVRLADGWQAKRQLDANGEAAVMLQTTVALMAANYAWLQGAREIFLIGVDYHGPHAEMIEPYARQSPGWESQYDRSVPDRVEQQFSVAAGAIAEAGGAIANLSPDTKLRAVPTATWKAILDS